MSNKYTILLPAWYFLLFFSCSVCRAQIEDRALLVDVKFWKGAGDTLFGKALYINQYNFQFNLTVCDTSGQPLAYYSPKDLAGFTYQTGDDNVEFTSMLNPVDMGRLFLRVVYRGKYTLYQLLDINYKTTVLSFLASYYLWDNEWILPAITIRYEKESLLQHFSACPELEYKIKTGQYGLPQTKTIIEEFEHCNLTDTYEFFYE